MASDPNPSPPALAVSTSLSTSASFASNHASPLNNSALYSTPLARQSSAGGVENLQDFLIRMKYSPMSKSANLSMSDVQSITNEIMGPSTWEQLNADQQVKMSFLVLRNQPALLSKVADHQNPKIVNKKVWVAEQINQALNMDSSYGRKLESFVRKGGTVSIKEGWDIPNFVTSFDGTTIFNHPDEFSRVEPYLHFQERGSTACYLVAVASAIFYSMRMHTGTNLDESIQHYALNVNRFKRNEFPDEEVYLYIFGTGGGYAHETVDRFLRPFNPSNDTLFTFLPIRHGDIQQKFVNVRGEIRLSGALVIRSFPLFEEYLDEKQLHFSGEWNDMTRVEGSHVLLIVGARLTNGEEMGGMEFLIQDSWEVRPFFTLGYDLLSSMGINEFLTVREGVSFSSGEYNVPHSPHGLRSGSSSFSEHDSQAFANSPFGFETVDAFNLEEQCGSGEECTSLPSWWMPVEPGTTGFRSG